MKNKENDNTLNSKIKLEENVITNETEVAEVFNNYFPNIASKLKKKKTIINSDFELLNSFIEPKVPSNTDFQSSLTHQTLIGFFIIEFKCQKIYSA